MGARVYLPTLGRFAQIDPIEGGTDNNYAYTNQPVTEYDLDGEAIWIPLGAGAVKVCKLLKKQCAVAGNKVKSTAKNAWNKIKNTRITIHKPHHSWPSDKGIKGKSWRYHVQIRNKTTNSRKQIPFGPHYLYKHGAKGPKGKMRW